MRLASIALGALLLAGCHHQRAAPRTLPPPPDFRVHTSTATERPLAASSSRRRIPPEETVFFAFNSVRLSQLDRESLGHVARWARAHPLREITIAGYADHIGPRDYNLALSVQRARAVQDYLQMLGVAPEQIVVIGRGETLAGKRAHPVDRRAIIVASQRSWFAPR